MLDPMLNPLPMYWWLISMMLPGIGKLNISLFPDHGGANGKVRPWIIS